MIVETGAVALLSAAHINPESGAIHGHTWEVTAWISPATDAERFKQDLEYILSEWDHGTLPADLWTAEALAKIVGERLGCTEVLIKRAEGYLARWRP